MIQPYRDLLANQLQVILAFKAYYQLMKESGQEIKITGLRQ